MESVQIRVMDNVGDWRSRYCRHSERDGNGGQCGSGGHCGEVTRHVMHRGM